MRNIFLCLGASIILSSCSDNGRYIPIASEGFLYITDTQNGKVYYWSVESQINSVHEVNNNVTPNYVDFITNAKEYKNE
jgi:hypothetical protein